MRGIRFVLTALAAAAVAVPYGNAASRPTVTVGMPFTGKWGYNVPVKPVDGKYNDATSSHPSVHAAPGGGDWATDLYAPVGEPVKLHVSSSGKLGFSWLSSSGCPSSTTSSTRIEVKVNGQPVGWIYYTHLAGAVRSGPIRNGMTLGTVANPATDGGCNPGHHVHIELKNARVSTHACWIGHGYPGSTVLKEGAPLGILGSNNKAKRQACQSTTKPTSSAHQKTAPVKTTPKPSATTFSGTYVTSDGYRFRFRAVMKLPVTVPRLPGPPGQMVLLGSPQMFDVTVTNLTPRRKALVFGPGNGYFGFTAFYKVPPALEEHRQKTIDTYSRLVGGDYLGIGNTFSYYSAAGAYNYFWLQPNTRWTPEPEHIVDYGNSYLEGSDRGLSIPESDYSTWLKLIRSTPDYVVLWEGQAFDGSPACSDDLLAWTGSGVPLDLTSESICEKIASLS